MEKSESRSLREDKPNQDDGYRRVIGGLTQVTRDLNPMTQENMLKIVYRLYMTDPLARRILEISRDFAIGDGLSFSAVDPKVYEILYDFWYDPVNDWSMKQYRRCLELGLYGEQIYPVFVNEVNGRVRMGYIDPLNISKIENNPENAEEPRWVFVTFKEKPYRVIYTDLDPQSPTYDRLVGDVFFFAINNVTLGTRGISDLLPLADFIDAYGQYLFNLLERSRLLNAFIWDVTVEGMNQDQIDEYIAKFGTPRPGAVRAHNEKIKWDVVSPKLEAADASEGAKLFLTHILGGAGLPLHYYAMGEGTTRATALEMAEPVLKRAQSRRKTFVSMIEKIFDFVIDQAIIHGTLPENVDARYSIIIPPITKRDLVNLSSAMAQITTALSLAEDKKWIQLDSAKEVFTNLVKMLGLEIEQVKAENPDAAAKESLTQVEERFGNFKGKVKGLFKPK